MAEAPESESHRYILITADTDFELLDANIQWHDIVVFYSPQNTYGVDFTAKTNQDEFLHIQGDSIQPSGCFQQATRCRNIQTLYYYGEVEDKPSKYTSVEEVKYNFKHHIETSKNITEVSFCLDENDDVKK